MIVRSISLQKELNEKIQEYCKATGRTVSGLVALLFKRLMEEQDGAGRSKDILEKES